MSHLGYQKQQIRCMPHTKVTLSQDMLERFLDLTVQSIGKEKKEGILTHRHTQTGGWGGEGSCPPYDATAVSSPSLGWVQSPVIKREVRSIDDKLSFIMEEIQFVNFPSSHNPSPLPIGTRS